MPLRPVVRSLVSQQPSARLLLIALLFLVAALSPAARSQPSAQWVRFEDGYGRDDVIEDAAVDGAGNLYVAGWTTNRSNNADYFIARYDRHGTRVWYHVYDGGAEDTAKSIAVRGSRVVVTGRSRKGTGFGADFDILTFVLDTAGTPAPDSSTALRYDHNRYGRDDDAVKVLFAPRAEGPGSLRPDIRADGPANDTLYILGTHRDTMSQADNLTILMYDSAGNQGVVIHSRPGDEAPVGMEVTPDAIYVLATAVDPSGFGSSYETVKFDRPLRFSWMKTYRNVGDDVPRGIAADGSGVYVTGSSRSACYDVDVATVAYDPDGTQLWANRSFDCASGQVGTGGILIDGTDVLAAGYHANGSQYFRIRKSDGTTIRMGDVWGVQSAWIGFVRSYDGNVYVAGHRLYFDVPANALHFVKFSGGDVLQWEVQFDGSGMGNPNTLRRMIASQADSSIILAGSVTVDGQEDMEIVKYGVGESLVTGVEEGGDRRDGVPNGFALDQNFPNPFNSSTILRYRLPERLKVSLRIYDPLGREVAVLAEGTQGPGEQTVAFRGDHLPSGIYLARLIAGRFSGIRKIVLVR